MNNDIFFYLSFNGIIIELLKKDLYLVEYDTTFNCEFTYLVIHPFFF